MADLDKPAETAFVCDTGAYDYATLPGGLWAYPSAANALTYPDFRHNETCNVSWCDGHAKAMKSGTLFQTEMNTSGRKVVYIPGGWPQTWTKRTDIRIFSYRQTSAEPGTYW